MGDEIQEFFKFALSVTREAGEVGYQLFNPYTVMILSFPTYRSGQTV